MAMLCEKIDKFDLPQFLAVCGNKWVAEEKYDGDRVRLRFKDGKVTLLNRRGVAVTEKYPEMLDFSCSDEVFLDGEMCVLDDKGVSQFNEGIAFRSHCKDPSKIASAAAEYPATFVAFDLLELNGKDLRFEPLRERRKLLEQTQLSHKSLVIAPQFTDIITAWQQMEKEGREGLILKDLGSLYAEGKRKRCWLKVKNIKEVIVTFNKYEPHPMGITVENTAGIRMTVNGHQSRTVSKMIDENGQCDIEIRHLGETKTGKFRQPVFFRIPEI